MKTKFQRCVDFTNSRDHSPVRKIIFPLKETVLFVRDRFFTQKEVFHFKRSFPSSGARSCAKRPLFHPEIIRPLGEIIFPLKFHFFAERDHFPPSEATVLPRQIISPLQEIALPLRGPSPYLEIFLLPREIALPRRDHLAPSKIALPGEISLLPREIISY